MHMQARQLQDWAKELQHRLATRPANQLLLPPSITDRHMRNGGMLVCAACMCVCMCVRICATVVRIYSCSCM